MSEITEDAVAQLTRIADALESLAAMQGSAPTEAPAAKAAKATTKKDAKPPKAKTLTIDEAKAKIQAELNSVASKTNTKMAAYKTLLGDWGLSKLTEAAEDDLETIVAAALSVMQKAAETSEVSTDDI